MPQHAVSSGHSVVVLVVVVVGSSVVVGNSTHGVSRISQSSKASEVGGGHEAQGDKHGSSIFSQSSAIASHCHWHCRLQGFSVVVVDVVLVQQLGKATSPQGSSVVVVVVVISGVSQGVMAGLQTSGSGGSLGGRQKQGISGIGQPAVLQSWRVSS
jgi:hypothetical protein